MPTLTINGNIRTNTAAGWAADATVYSAKTILVTTDAYWGSTDQRKFKIADGTQTWSNLDYFPVSGYDDASSSIQTQLNAKLTSANIVETITNGVTTNAPSENAVFDALALKKTIATGNAYKFETTDVSGNLQETTVTASRAVATDANGLPTASATTATELGYVNGVTSAIQTQLNSKPCIEFMFGTTTVYNPADSTTYYFTFQTNLIINTTATLRQFKGVDKTVFSFWVYVDPQGTLGSNEDVTFNLRNITDGVSSLLGTLDFTVRGKMVLMDVATPILMSSSKYYSIEMVTPAWATNPTSVATLGKIICR